MKVNKKFAEVTRSLKKEERDRLAKSIKTDGVRDPIVLWNDWIIDGHNRREIANELGWTDDQLPTVHKDFASDEEAIQWIKDTQGGRRNLDDPEYRLLIGEEYAEAKATPGRPKTPGKQDKKNSDTVSELSSSELDASPGQAVAEKHGVSERTARRLEKVAEAHEKLVKPAKVLYADGKLTGEQVKKLAAKSPEQQHEIATQIRKGIKRADELLGKSNGKKPKPATKPVDLAKKNRQLAHDYRDKLARAICDYHEVKPNRKERDRLVKLVQGVTLW